MATDEDNTSADGRAVSASPENLWQRLTRTANAPRPRLDADQIANAAIKIADSDGLASLSMRKVAQVLGSGTMSLYHYVKTRDELLLLMHDTVIGELELSDIPADDWRTEMIRVSTRMRAIATRHPWISELPFPSDPGPNFSKLREYLQRVDYEGLEVSQVIDLVRTVLAFVHGVIAMEASEPRTRGMAGQQTSDDTTGPDFDHDAMFKRQLGYVLTGLEAELIHPVRMGMTSE